MAPLDREKADALDALERLLLRHKLIDAQQAQTAARLITGDPDVTFPPKRERPTPDEKAEPKAEPELAKKGDANALKEGAPPSAPGDETPPS